VIRAAAAGWPIAAAALFLLFGCTGGTGGHRQISGLDPAASPPTSERANLGGLALPVTVSAEHAADELRVNVKGPHEVYWTESYLTKRDGFYFMRGAGDEFEPPIRILPTEPSAGATWSWKGKISSGGGLMPASATITTGDDNVYVGQIGMDALRVRVDISIPDAAGHEAQREMTFWFASGHGIVQAKFGSGSERYSGGG